MHLLPWRHHMLPWGHVMLPRRHTRAHWSLPWTQPRHTAHWHSDIGHRHLWVHLVGHVSRKVCGARVTDIVPP